MYNAYHRKTYFKQEDIQQKLRLIIVKHIKSYIIRSKIKSTDLRLDPHFNRLQVQPADQLITIQD